MAGHLNAKVVLAKCSKSKNTFGVRIEQRGKDWVRTWAFPIDEHKAKREKFDAEKITFTSDEKDDDYPGCPHCGATRILYCQCGKINCYAGEQFVTCSWCGNSGAIQNVDSVDVSGGGY